MSRPTILRLGKLAALGLAVVLAACSDGDGFSGRASRVATVTVDDGISWLNNGVRDVGYEIRAIRFSVNSQGPVTVDVLSAGVMTPSLDAQIYLLRDDENPDIGDVLYVNDDGEPGADGSLLELDSYLQVELAPGDYLLYVSGCCYSAEDALAGYRLVTGSDSLGDLTEGGANGEYQVTITGDVGLNSAD